jgi:hypothetical protein
MHMVMLVLDDPSQLDEVVQAWRNAGISGATILESMGAYCRETRHVRGRYLVGDLSEPNTGVFAAWELSLAKGAPEGPGDLRARE